MAGIQTIVRLSTELRKAAEERAASMGLNLTSYIRHLITMDIKRPLK